MLFVNKRYDVSIEMKSKEEILSDRQDLRSLAGVYFLIRKRTIVYIGESANVFKRVREQQIAGVDFDSFSYHLLRPVSDEMVTQTSRPRDHLRLALEEAYIKSLEPEGNKQHMPGGSGSGW